MNAILCFGVLAAVFSAAYGAGFTSNVDCAGMYLSCIEKYGANPDATVKVLNQMSNTCHEEIRKELACKGVDSVPFRRMKIPVKEEAGAAPGAPKESDNAKSLEDGKFNANIDCAGLYLDCIEWEATWQTASVSTLNSMGKRCKNAIKVFRVCQGHDMWTPTR